MGKRASGLAGEWTGGLRWWDALVAWGWWPKLAGWGWRAGGLAAWAGEHSQHFKNFNLFLTVFGYI